MIDEGVMSTAAGPAARPEFVTADKRMATLAQMIGEACGEIEESKNPSAHSLLAAQTLRRIGYEHAQVLEGGLNAWAACGLPGERAQQ
jgi:hypothetical protein